MQPVGYNRLLQESTVKALPPARLAEVRAVTRKEVIGHTLARIPNTPDRPVFGPISGWASVLQVYQGI